MRGEERMRRKMKGEKERKGLRSMSSIFSEIFQFVISISFHNKKYLKHQNNHQTKKSRGCYRKKEHKSQGRNEKKENTPQTLHKLWRNQAPCKVWHLTGTNMKDFFFAVFVFERTPLQLSSSSFYFIPCKKVSDL